MKKIFSILFKLIATFILLLFIALSIAVIFRLTIDLSFLKPSIEKAAKFTIGREVKINGPVNFEFSHLTVIAVRDVHIANVPNASHHDFFKAGLARFEIELIPLLKGEIQISEIIAENVTFNLENNVKGGANWIFPKIKAKVETSTSKRLISFRGVDKLSFKNIGLTYYDVVMKKTIHTQLDSMMGKISGGKPIIMDFNGHVNNTSFHINLEGLPIEQLMDKTKLWAFKLNGEVGGRNIVAKGSFIHNDVPEVKMMLGIKDVDIGLILSRLELIKGLSASAADASLRFSLKGNNLKQILEESTMYFVVKDGKWKIKTFKDKNSFEITHLNGNITVEQGNNLKIELTGNLQDEAIKLNITGSPLVDFAARPDRIPIVFDAELAKIKLQVASAFALPLTSKDVNLTFNFSGERLDSVNQLFKLKLPPIGPFNVDTQLHLTDKGYDLSKLNIKVGDTTLNGKMNLDLTQKKPVIDMTLISDKIQINDFIFKKNIKKLEANIRKLLSKEVLGSFDGKIKVEAREILSGKDRLGSLSSIVGLKNTRLTLNPLRLNFPGGIVNIDLSFLPQKDNAVIDLKAKIDKFDIGIIARRSKPGTDMGGFLYLDTSLHSVTPTIKDMLKNAKGHFDFGIIPKNFSSSTMDFWAVNLISTIINKETEQNQSLVNCFIMRFGIDDGFMQDKIVYMDTSHMIVTGKAEISFPKETINIMMAPKAKRPQFKLELPIKIVGTFKDFDWKLSKMGLLSSVISFVASPVTVPIKHVFVDQLPRDGENACLKAWRYVEEVRVKDEKLSVHERNLKILEGR
ncbi:AsmA-like C-terminal region-containing protein [Sulfurovum sp.]|uniref:AsmA family protein n=1 Tax=Sulfurovum sp. TaxID=1969726 RepID=UPI00286829DD|nr:AsmA-like C-terminal region-containing protein [Sulfurovum sp.]